MKKGQVTLFIILGIVMIVFFVFLFSTKEKVEQKKTETITTKTLLSDSELQYVRTYVESSLRKVSDDVMFNKSEIKDIYKLPGNEDKLVYYKGIEYPLLYDSKCISDDCPGGEFYNESISKIEKNISKRVAVEFKKSINLSIFGDVYNISESDIDYKNVNVTVNFGDKDIELKNYSIVLKKKKKTEGKLDAFRVNLPIKLGLIYNNITMNLLQNISNYDFYQPTSNWPQDEEMNHYDLSEHCEEIVPGGCEANPNTISKIEFIETVEDMEGVIVIEDNRTRQYPGGFNLTFGLYNVNISGMCECGTDVPIIYTLTTNVDPVGWGTITADPDRAFYDPGEIVDLTAVAEAGYEFDYWEGDVADPNSASTTITMDGHKTVTAHFVEEFILAPLVVKNDNGEEIVTFGDEGNIYLRGSCTANVGCDSPLSDYLVIKNTADDTVAYVDDGGNLCIDGGDCTGNDDCSSPEMNSFVIKDNSDVVVIYFTEDGNLCFIGDLFEGYY